MAMGTMMPPNSISLGNGGDLAIVPARRSCFAATKPGGLYRSENFWEDVVRYRRNVPTAYKGEHVRLACTIRRRTDPVRGHRQKGK